MKLEITYFFVVDSSSTIADSDPIPTQAKVLDPKQHIPKMNGSIQNEIFSVIFKDMMDGKGKLFV